MTNFGSIEGAKRKAHVTIANANAEMEGYIQHSNRLIITRVRLHNNGNLVITNPEFRQSLDEHAEDIAANKWHMENDPERHTKGYEIAMQQMKDTVHAEFDRSIDGHTHATFKKTTGKITSDTRGIGTTI